MHSYPERLHNKLQSINFNVLKEYSDQSVYLTLITCVFLNFKHAICLPSEVEISMYPFISICPSIYQYVHIYIYIIVQFITNYYIET